MSDATADVRVRRGGARDVRFLRDMLHHAYYWKERAPDSGPGPVALYVKAWGRRGDTAVIAIDNGFPAGAAWYRLFTRAQPGYGFVDEATPELAIAVVPSARGKGIGGALLDLAPRARTERRAPVAVAQRRPAQRVRDRALPETRLRAGRRVRRLADDARHPRRPPTDRPIGAC